MRIKLLILLAFLASALCASAAEKKSEDEYLNSYAMERAKEAISDGKIEEAQGWLDRELEDEPDNGYAYIFKAAIYKDAGEYGKQVTAATMAIKKLPKKDKEVIATTYSLRAEAYLELADTVGALADYSKAIELNPEENDYYHSRANIYYFQNKLDLAEADYRTMLRNNPADELAFMGLGRNAQEKGNTDEAIELFTHVTKLAPDYGSGFSFRGANLLKKKEYVKAVDDFIKAIEVDGDAKGAFHLAFIEEAALPVMKAKILAQMKKDPGNYYWPYLIAYGSENNGRYKDAIEYYEKSNKLNPSPGLLYRISGCYDDLGNYGKALEYINRCIKADSTDSDYMLSKANICCEMGRYDDAIASADRYVEDNPDNYFAYYRRGWFKQEAGDYDGAIGDYSMSIALEPCYAYAYTGRGKLYKDQGKDDLAKADFEMAIGAELAGDTNGVPNSAGPSAHYAYFYLGEKDKAVEYMDSLLAANADRAGTRYDAACLYSLMGEKEKAVDYLRQAFEMGFRRLAHIKTDDDLDGLRDMPEFKALIEEYIAKAEKENAESDSESGSEGNGEGEATETVQVPFTRESGVTKVKCTINGLPLHFVFDTGAADVTMSMVEAGFMLKNEYIKPADIVGAARYIDANGDITEGTVVNLRKVDFGGLELDNVRASVVRNQKAPLLLGQSVLSRLGKIEIDNDGRILKITRRKTRK